MGGAEMFNGKRDPQSKWTSQLAKGPMVVGMDASFRGFGQYRPSTFEPLSPFRCGASNHAVVAVGRVFENGNEYLLVRNSWGSSWGYKGYFKITRSTNCGITALGWLPKVTKGAVPDPDNKPKPKPIPANDCIELYGRYGFRSKPFMKPCDSVPELKGAYYFYGVKFPRNTTSGNPIKIMTFPYENCNGDWAMPVEKDTEQINREGYFAYPASLAFQKKASKEGCIDFYTDYCHKGQTPEFTVCDDIKDTQLINFTKISKVLSILPSSGIKRISFHSEPNYLDNGFSIDGGAIYSVDNNHEFASFIKYGTIRSVKIHRN